MDKSLYKFLSILICLLFTFLVISVQIRFSIGSWNEVVTFGLMVIVLLLSVYNNFIGEENIFSFDPQGLLETAALCGFLLFGVFIVNLFISYLWTSVFVTLGVVLLIVGLDYFYRIGHKDGASKTKLEIITQTELGFTEALTSPNKVQSGYFKTHFKQVSQIVSENTKSSEDIRTLMKSKEKLLGFKKNADSKTQKLKKTHQIELNDMEKKHDKSIKKLEKEIVKVREEAKNKIDQLSKDQEDEIKKINEGHEEETEAAIQRSNERFNNVIHKLRTGVEKDLEDKVKAFKKGFLLSLFSNPEKEFSASKVFERQLEEEKLKERKNKVWKEEQELAMKNLSLEVDKKVYEARIDFEKGDKELDGKISEETLNRQKDVFALQKEDHEIKKSVTDLKTFVLDNLTKLEFFVKEGFLKVRESMTVLKMEVAKGLDELNYKLREEVLTIKNDQIKIVNKFENFQTVYAGDMRQIQQQFDGTILYIDRKAMEAHEYTKAVEYRFTDEVNQLRNADYELAKSLFLVEANLNEKINAVDEKVDRNALIHKYELEKLSNTMQSQIEKVVNRLNLTESELKFLIKEKHYEMKDFVNKNFNRIENDLFGFRAETREGFYKLDTKIGSNAKEFAQNLNLSDTKLRYLIEKKGYEDRDFTKSNVSKIEKDLLVLKNTTQESIYQLDVKYDARIKELAYETGTDIKKLHNLMVMKNLTLEQLLNKTNGEIRKEIKKLETDHKVKYVETEAKWSVKFNDMETLNQKNKHEVLQALQNFSGEIMQFQKGVNSMQNQIEKMQMQIERVGVDNDRIKEEARRLIQDAEDRFAQIIQLIRNFDDKAALTRDTMALNAKESMLELRDITKDQQLALKEIAMGEKGVELIYNDRKNRLVETENRVTLAQERLNMSKQSMKDSQRQERQSLKHQQDMWNIQDELKWEKEDLRREKERADYWSKESKKKSGYSKYRISSHDFTD